MKFHAICLILCTLKVGYIHGETVTIQINHYNDISSQLERFEPLQDSDDLVPKGGCVNNNSTIPPVVCHGGVAHLLNFQKEEHIKAKNYITLTSGNLVGGDSGWLSIVGWDKFGSLIRDHYQPSAMSLGIKDFGAGLARTWEYLNPCNTNCAIREPLDTNIVLSNIKNCNSFQNNETEHLICNQIKPYVTLDVEADTSGAVVKIGVVGFINPNVMKLASPGKLEFDENINDALTGPINELKNLGVQFIIALGDGYFTTATGIIDSHPEVKLVIYGSGLGSSKNMKGNYPEKYGQSYIATAGKFGATLGKLIINFESSNGVTTIAEGSTLVDIDENISPNAIVANTIAGEYFKLKVLKEEQDILGRSHVTIHGGKVCWANECNLGNVMADAAVHCVYGNKNLTDKLPEGPVLGIWHGGAFFYDKVQQKTEITALDVHKWLPFHNNVHLVRISGSGLKKLFEASATALDEKPSPDWGQFFQVSNAMEVTYSTNGGKGKLERIRVLKEEDTIPKMVTIEDDERYLLALPSFIREGGSIFGFVKNGFFDNIVDAPGGYHYIDFDDTCLIGYIRGLNGLTTGFEERIFLDTPGGSSPPDSRKCKNNTAKHVLLTLFLTLLVLGGAFVAWKFIWPRYNNHYSSRFS